MPNIKSFRIFSNCGNFYNCDQIQPMDIPDRRREYSLAPLEKKDLAGDPFVQFGIWFQEAEKIQGEEANAMALATVDQKKRPSCRMVLLKSWDGRGFVFFTNYLSRKGRELYENPQAAATFYWDKLEKQVCIEGSAEKISRHESESYFKQRPRKSQIGAWASLQDVPLNSRAILEECYAIYELKYRGKEIPMPPYWGGFRIIPKRFEFWKGRENRLHDRFEYFFRDNGWHIQRLSP